LLNGLCYTNKIALLLNSVILITEEFETEKIG